MKSQWSLSLITMMLLLLFSCEKEDPIPQKPRPESPVTELWDGYANAINEKGQVAGHSFTDNRAMLWDGDQAIELWDGYVSGINEKAQVVGSRLSDGKAMLWDDGQAIELWGVGYAYDINEKGQIAGRSRNTAILWTPK